MLLIKNPAGANEAIRTLVEGAAPRVAVIALNDAIADGRDVSWIWDVDFEPLLGGLDRLVATGSRAAELALRFAYGGLDRDRIEVVPSLDAALDRGLELTPAGGELTVLPTYTAMLALRRTIAARGHVTNYWERARMRDPRSGTSIPDYLNIYADRGNIAVLAARARARGHELDVQAIGMGDAVPAGRSTSSTSAAARTASRSWSRTTSPRRATPLREAVEGGAAFLAVCGGYQLLGRFYRDVAGTELPGIGLLPLHTVAGERRMIGDVLLECAWAGETLAGFENHAGRTILDDGAEPLGRVVSGFGNDGASGFEGCRYKRAYGTYLHGPLLPRNPWFADRLLEEALAHAGVEERFEPLPDELEREAHAVSAARARSRGGANRY